MKCPHCKYVSFDFLDVCKKCGKDLIEIKAKHNIVTFRPATITLGDAAFYIAYPPSAEAAAHEEPAPPAEEESAAAPSEGEPAEEFVLEPTGLTLREEKAEGEEAESGRESISLEEEGIPLSGKDEEVLELTHDETMGGAMGVEEDLGRTLGAEDTLVKEHVRLTDEGSLAEDTLSPENLVKSMFGKEVEESGKDTGSRQPLSEEAELELDMEALELPSMPSDEPTPPDGLPLKADLGPLEEEPQEPEERTLVFERTEQLVSSDQQGEETLEPKAKGAEEEEGMFELTITEEDLRKLDESK